jgi:hypothetical protein
MTDPFADLREGDDTEPAQPPSFLLDRDDDNPVHPFDTEIHDPSSAEEGWWSRGEDEETLITAHFVSSPDTDSTASRSDSQDSPSDPNSSPYKTSTEWDPSAYRVGLNEREQSLVAPPTTVENISPRYRACGCGECDERHFLDGDGGTVECPTPVPVTVAGARRIYRKAEGGQYADESAGNDPQRGKEKYEKLSKADTTALWTDDGNLGEYVRSKSDFDDITTVLISLRIPPTDNEDRLVTPYQQVVNTRDAWAEARGKLPTNNEDTVLSAYYWTFAGTEQWATPHVHAYLWIADPDDEVVPQDFRPVVTEFVESSAYARWDSHLESDDRAAPLDDGTVRIEHEPLLVEPVGLHIDDVEGGAFADVKALEESPDRLTDDGHVQTRGAVYVGSQLPQLALAGRETPAEREAAAFFDVVSDGRQIARGNGDFYELAKHYHLLMDS